MSIGWAFLGLLFVSPFYEAALIQRQSYQHHEGRPKRSIMNLNEMVKSVTSREGSDFIEYGNWCGLGGSGTPVDRIDQCCKIHDFCYNFAKKGVCKRYGEKGVYQIDYKWSMADDGTAKCEDEDDRCKSRICKCDAFITECLKNNMEFYNEENLHKLNLFEMIKEADYLTS